ncbi:hypothetical protein Ancab_031379 [Ancistrocladus abbreviatus]
MAVCLSSLSCVQLWALGMGLWLERHKDQLDTMPYYRKRYFYTWKKEQENIQILWDSDGNFLLLLEFHYSLPDHDTNLSLYFNGVSSIRTIVLHDRRQAYV